MDFDYGESPFVRFGDHNDEADSKSLTPGPNRGTQEYRKIVSQIDQQARQSDVDDRLKEFFYMSAVFACKAFLYFILQDAYEHGFYSANL